MSDVANEMFKDNNYDLEIETFINADINKNKMSAEQHQNNKTMKKSPVPSINLGEISKYQEEFEDLQQKPNL